MTSETALLAALGVLVLWWQRSSSATTAAAAQPVTVNAAPQITQEDDTGEALRDLLVQLGKDPNRQVDLSFVGRGLDVNFVSRPWTERRLRIPGEPDIKIP